MTVLLRIALLLAAVVPQDNPSSPAAIPSLSVGDVPPPLAVQAWIKGDPVDLEKGRGKECYLVWFWRPGDLGSQQLTPRLTILQERYASKGLKIVGIVTEDDKTTIDIVREYVDKAGPQLGWTAAFDKGRESWDAFLVASAKPGESIGLPKGLLINRTGVIVWIGTPVDPNFEDGLVDLVEDRFDPEVWAKMDEIDRRIVQKARNGRWREVNEEIDELLRVYPHNSKAVNFKVFVFTQQLKDFEGMNAWSRELYAAYGRDPHIMLNLATAVTNPAVMGDISTRDPEPGYRAARVAYEAAVGTPLLGDAAPIYARALFQLGAVRQGRAVLADACEKIKGFEADSMRAELSFYERCVKLLDEIERDGMKSATGGAAASEPKKQAAP